MQANYFWSKVQLAYLRVWHASSVRDCDSASNITMIQKSAQQGVRQPRSLSL